MTQPDVLVVTIGAPGPSAALLDALGRKDLTARSIAPGGVLPDDVDAADALVVVVEETPPDGVAALELINALAGRAQERAVPAVLLLGVDADDDPAAARGRFEVGDLLVITYESDFELEVGTSYAARYLASLLGSRPARSADLTVHPPAARPEADDAGMVVTEIEGLLAWAERLAADEATPADLRHEVEARLSQLVHELGLIGEGRGSSAVLAGLTAALLPLVRPEPADDPLGAAADEVADAVVALGEATSDDEIVAAGEDVVTALDHVGEEMARYGVDDVREAALRAAGAWFEHDARGHLNAFIVGAREKALPAATGGVVTNWMGGPPWLVVTVVALGLLRARFPWIFRRGGPPEPPDQP